MSLAGEGPRRGHDGCAAHAPAVGAPEVFIAGPFGDVRDDATHAGSIDWLAGSGITAGCGEGDFCPSAQVTWEQMATFLRNALE